LEFNVPFQHKYGYIRDEGNGGVGVGMNRARAVTGGERQGPVRRAAGWPCGVCGGGFGGDSVQCTGCHGWVRGGVVVWREACAK